MDWSKYRSRKLGMSILIACLTYLLARAGQMDAHVALIFSTIIGSYNLTQGWIDKEKAKNETI